MKHKIASEVDAVGSVRGTGPVLFEPHMRNAQEGEKKTEAGLIKALRSILDVTYRDAGCAIRSVHAKSHGVVVGTLTVHPGVHPSLAQGLFARAKSYPVDMRFSTSPGDILSDAISTPRGVAVKVRQIDGAVLPDAPGGEQDFLLVNGPAFLVPDAKRFLPSLKILAATTNKAPGLKKAASAMFRAIGKVLAAFGKESAILKGLGGHPATHLLGETFFSQVPIRYGAYVAKISVVPVSSNLVALKNAPVDISEPDALRRCVAEFFSANDAVWELRVQLCTDLSSMPIEDAAVVWPEDQSAFHTIATISVPRQNAWDGQQFARIEAASFSPWHALVDHEPLGAIMRARRETYKMSAAFRRERPQCPFHPL